LLLEVVAGLGVMIFFADGPLRRKLFAFAGLVNLVLAERLGPLATFSLLVLILEQSVWLETND